MSDIAQTASITLITAVPGSGKTLRAVWYIQQAIERGDQVFVCNINGLNIEGAIDFPDPTKWQDLPANSVLVVDECQQFFRADRGLPSYIAAMETIRHMGIRLILLTQHPALIHCNIRALVGFHEHLVRENGKESAIVYTRSRVIDNVRSDKALAAEDHYTWAFPKDCYDLYTSAEVHTFKRTIPHKYKRAALLALVALTILGGVVWQIRAAVYGDDAKPAQAAAGGVLAAGNAGRQSAGRVVIASADDYAHQLQPMVDDAPWTAPAFVNREMVSEPGLFCMSTGHMRGKIWHVETCRCITEQGTRYELDLLICADIARNGGRYNPYKRPIVDQPSRETDPTQPQEKAVAGSSADQGQVVSGDAQIAAYGSMRNREWPALTFDRVR